MNSFLCCLLLGIDTQWEGVKKMEPPTQLCTLKRQETRGGKQDIPGWYNEKKIHHESHQTWNRLSS